MIGQRVADYLRELAHAFGAGWNRFWYTPRDPRMVCALRIAAGLCALAFVISHTADLVRWMGPDGILDAQTTLQLNGQQTLGPTLRYSYLFLAATPASLWILHGAGIVTVVALTVGLWSRWTAPAALLVVLAYVHRMPLLTGQWEPVLTMLLAYLSLAPTGRCWSLDALLARRRARRGGARDAPSRPQPSVAANISVRLIQLHLAALCILTGLNMLAADVWWSGEAVWWLIARTESRLVNLTALSDAFLLVNAWTHVIVLYLLVFGVLVWHRLARPLLLVLGIPFWLSLALLTGLVAWCLTMLLASLAFVESQRGVCHEMVVEDR
ncbi:MAG: hypothetical protein MUF48_13140 [Pirellulaceae bacterium]|nr:hypothetical protein [Pirellulaceae bacterium]